MQLKKRKYSFDKIKSLIEADDYIISGKIHHSADSLGFSEYEVASIISKLNQEHFLKSETQHNNHTIWHDYYRITVKDMPLYIKFKIIDIDGEEQLIVTSFKRDEQAE